MFRPPPPTSPQFGPSSLLVVRFSTSNVPDSDRLYSRILRELYSPAWLRHSGRESYVLVARKLGIDDKTVRSTIGRMQRSGFLKGWSISLNPHILAMECGSVLVRAGERAPPKEETMSRLRDVEGVVAIFSFLDDPGFRLVFYYDDDLDFERKVRLVSAICGVSKPYASWKIPFPPCRVKTKKTDWQIIRLLLEDSKKNVSEIAKEVGVSSRTVRRRLEAMAEGNSYFPNPVVDPKKVEGFLYHFVIAYHNSKDKEITDELLHKSSEELVFVDTNAELYSVTASICQNIFESRQISDWLKAQRGVREVTVRVFEAIVPVNDWIGREIEKRLRG
jgi:DNA-binding Lrp family transcriptional regulator